MMERKSILKYLAVSVAIVLFPSLSLAIVRPPAVAGRWYPEEAKVLCALIEAFLKKAELPSSLPPKINALIVPHAGYRFCGQTAAYAYKAIKGKNYKYVVIIAPTHYARFYGASTLDVDAYKTPLGEVPLERRFIKALLASPLFKEYTLAHLREHAIEAQLPFLQVVLGKFKLIPILIGQITDEDVFRLANTIKSVFSNVMEETLFIASSDFTHFGPMYGYVPFKENILQNIKRLDKKAIEFILKGDAKGLLGYYHQTNITICGLYPIAITIFLLPKKAKGVLLHYSNSADILGDYSNCVSYAAIVLDEPSLDEKDKKRLLKLARFTLEYCFEHGYPPSPKEVPIEITPALREKKGAFVTLKKHGELRGCIGFIKSIFPLYETVMRASVQAAFFDPRFYPLRKDELCQVKIEISVLGPIVPVKDIKEIKIGRDGLIIKKDGYQGLLLPQVATELKLNRTKFLELTCKKAGLPKTCWKEGAEIYRFTAEVFKED